MVLGEQGDRGGVLQHEAEPIDGVGRVERDIGAPGLEDGEQGDDHLEAALHTEGDAGVGLDAELA